MYIIILLVNMLFLGVFVSMLVDFLKKISPNKPFFAAPFKIIGIIVLDLAYLLVYSLVGILRYHPSNDFVYFAVIFGPFIILFLFKIIFVAKVGRK